MVFIDPYMEWCILLKLIIQTLSVLNMLTSHDSLYNHLFMQREALFLKSRLRIVVVYVYRINISEAV